MTPHDSEKDVVLAEYKEVTAQFRVLTDIRFKLLAFLPLGTVAAVYVSNTGQLPNEPAIPAFAFVVTLCIATYNKRNDQHYDELVARAAELERDGLELAHGSFSQRPASWCRGGCQGIRPESAARSAIRRSSSIWSLETVRLPAVFSS